jgi:ABC-type transport system involved in cytochrome c biogenesis permease subunit
MGYHIQILLFSVAFSILTFSCILYLGFFIKRKDEWWEGATTAGLVGIIPLASGIFLRFIFAKRVFFFSAFEVTVLISFVILIIHFAIERRYVLKVGGIVLFPIALFFLGLALILPDKATPPLAPMLKSYWFFLHSLCGVIGYAFFSVGLGMVILYLLKTKTPLSILGLWLTGGTVLTYTLLDGGAILRGSYHLERMVLHQIGEEKNFTSATKLFNYFLGQGYTGEELSNLLPLKIHIPLVGEIFSITLILLAISFILYLTYFFQKERRWERKALFFTRAALPFQFLALFLLSYQIPRISEVYFVSNPFEFSLIILLFFLNLGFVILSFFYHPTIEHLPQAEFLSEFGYKTIGTGFFFNTLFILLGAFWAQEAFGNYWANTPDEWWLGITWLLYASSLHLWKWGKERNAIWFSLLGYAALIFTLFGVSSFVSGFSYP